MKVAPVRTLQQRFPDKRYLGTKNAESNDHMIAINTALCFRTVSRRTEWEADALRILQVLG